MPPYSSSRPELRSTMPRATSSAGRPGAPCPIPRPAAGACRRRYRGPPRAGRGAPPGARQGSTRPASSRPPAGGRGRGGDARQAGDIGHAQAVRALVPQAGRPIRAWPAAAASLSCMQLSENFGDYHQLANAGQGKTIVRCVDSTLMRRPCIAENSLFKNSNRPLDGQYLHGDIMIPGHKPGCGALPHPTAAGVRQRRRPGGLSGQACPHRGRLFRRRNHRRDRPHHGQN